MMKTLIAVVVAALLGGCCGHRIHWSMKREVNITGNTKEIRVLACQNPGDCYEVHRSYSNVPEVGQ